MNDTSSPTAKGVMEIGIKCNMRLRHGWDSWQSHFFQKHYPEARISSCLFDMTHVFLIYSCMKTTDSWALWEHRDMVLWALWYRHGSLWKDGQLALFHGKARHDLCHELCLRRIELLHYIVLHFPENIIAHIIKLLNNKLFKWSILIEMSSLIFGLFELTS